MVSPAADRPRPAPAGRWRGVVPVGPRRTLVRRRYAARSTRTGPDYAARRRTSPARRDHRRAGEPRGRGGRRGGRAGRHARPAQGRPRPRAAPGERRPRQERRGLRRRPVLGRRGLRDRPTRAAGVDDQAPHHDRGPARARARPSLLHPGRAGGARQEAPAGAGRRRRPVPGQQAGREGRAHLPAPRRPPHPRAEGGRGAGAAGRTPRASRLRRLAVHRPARQSPVGEELPARTGSSPRSPPCGPTRAARPTARAGWRTRR